MTRRTTTRIARLLASALIAASVVVALPSSAGAADTWVRRAAASPSASGNTLISVSCTTVTDCTAVGSYTTVNGAKALIVRTTDGTTWTRVASPNPGIRFSQLNDVSCTTPTDCTAVGTYATAVVDGQFQLATLVVRTTNGANWAIVPSPNPNGFPSALWGVSCTTPTRCRAVGDNGGTSLVLRTSNGATWFRQPSPNRGRGANYLISIDCVSNSTCVAVGFYYASTAETENTKTLGMHADGPTWRLDNVPNPSPNAGDNYMSYVSCVAPSTCTAVGTADPIPGPTKRAFILHTGNNGGHWARAATPARTDTSVIDLRGVSCLSATECTAVGIEWNTAHTTIRGTILRTTNGTSWVDSGPSGQLLGYDNWGVSCPLAGRCQTVGGFNTTGDPNGVFKSLILKEK